MKKYAWLLSLVLRINIVRLNKERYTRKVVHVGLGTKPPFMKLDDYVLSRFSEDEREQLPNIATVFGKNIESIVDKGIEKALNTVSTCA